MGVIFIIGPHAVGKTSALARYKARYKDLVRTVSLDAERRKYPDNPAKEALVRSPGPVLIVESARGFTSCLRALAPEDRVIVLTCSVGSARAWWGERRFSKGRNVELGICWTDKRLYYECNGHFINPSIKYLSKQQYQVFNVEDRSKDWETIDQYVYKLFRTLHNRGNS